MATPRGDFRDQDILTSIVVLSRNPHELVGKRCWMERERAIIEAD